MCSYVILRTETNFSNETEIVYFQGVNYFSIILSGLDGNASEPATY